ncbi:MAG: hypothetical protein J2P19_16545, partial [Pseudonocardia sp.]|nr:hypothetical protein [Pseudonocardia sp.]
MRNNEHVPHSESHEPPEGARAGWSSGSRRRKMWVTVDGGHTRPPVRDNRRPAEAPPDVPYQPEPPAWLDPGNEPDLPADGYHERHYPPIPEPGGGPVHRPGQEGERYRRP